MCVFACVCVCAYVYMCVRYCDAYTGHGSPTISQLNDGYTAHTQTHGDTHTQTHGDTHTHICMHIHTHNTHTHNIHTHTYTYTHTYTHTYIHTYTHTQTHDYATLMIMSHVIKEMSLREHCFPILSIV